MPRTLPLISALAIVLGTGVVQNRWVDRAATARALEDATARLGRLPMIAGEWRGGEIEMDRRGLDRAGIAGLAALRFENAQSGALVSVLVVCGRPGPIAAHGPEVCYAGAGFERVTDPARCPVPGSAGDEFWVSDFQNLGVVPPQTLRIYWSWSASGACLASGAPRVEFAGESVIYKYYVIQENPLEGAGASHDPCLEFAATYWPRLRHSLFPRT